MLIQIRGRIEDTQKLNKDRLILKKLIEWEIEQILNKYGFEKCVNTYLNERVLMNINVQINEENNDKI